MFDPSALGTLRIGLDAIQADADRAATGETSPATDRRHAPVGNQRQPRTRLRVTLAGTLRRLADALEPRTVEGLPG